MSPPARFWNIRQTPTGATLAMTDYAGGGKTKPVASVSVASVDEEIDAAAAGLKFLDAFTSHFEDKVGLASK